MPSSAFRCLGVLFAMTAIGCAGHQAGSVGGATSPATSGAASQRQALSPGANAFGIGADGPLELPTAGTISFSAEPPMTSTSGSPGTIRTSPTLAIVQCVDLRDWLGMRGLIAYYNSPRRESATLRVRVVDGWGFNVPSDWFERRATE
jgi:hypothetical protein